MNDLNGLMDEIEAIDLEDFPDELDFHLPEIVKTESRASSRTSSHISMKSKQDDCINQAINEW